MNTSFIFRSLLAATIGLMLCRPALSHEFWIEVERYQLSPGDTLTAQFKNGQQFQGINLGFFTRRSQRFDYQLGDDLVPLSPRIGNIPVLDMPAPADGLMVIVHETTVQKVDYDDWQSFQDFADHKDFPNIRERHLERGLPLEGFSESYTRHAKALVGIGTAQGADRAMGLETEFVALTNPYTGIGTGEFVVQLLYQGAPRADAQVEVFDRGPDGVEITLYRTDDQGQARIPVTTGHDYLLDAVVLRPAPDNSEYAWDTLWAALTFAVP